MSTAIVLLQNARDIVEYRGWCQNSYVEEDGSVCTLGALQIGMPAGAWLASARQEALAYLHAALPDAYRNRGVISFNDADERTKQEVIDLFDRAIAFAQVVNDLPGKSKRIVVEPMEVPQESPQEVPVTPEKVPA